MCIYTACILLWNIALYLLTNTYVLLTTALQGIWMGISRGCPLLWSIPMYLLTKADLVDWTLVLLGIGIPCSIFVIYLNKAKDGLRRELQDCRAALAACEAVLEAVRRERGLAMEDQVRLQRELRKAEEYQETVLRALMPAKGEISNKRGTATCGGKFNKTHEEKNEDLSRVLEKDNQANAEADEFSELWQSRDMYPIIDREMGQPKDADRISNDIIA